MKKKCHPGAMVTMMNGLIPAGGCSVFVICINAIASPTAGAASQVLDPNDHNTTKPATADSR